MKASSKSSRIGSRLLSPACLVFALICLFCAFALLAKGSPEVDIHLHRARIGDNQEHQTRLEKQLAQKKWKRRLLIGGLFGTSIVFVAAGFLSLNPKRTEDL